MSKQSVLDTPLKHLEIDAVVGAVKLVLPEDLREYCTAEAIADIYKEADYRELSVRLNTNRFTTVCRKAKRMANMFAMSGVFLGARDLLTKKMNWEAIRATGQRALIMRLDQEQIVEPTIWGHGPGDRNHKKIIPFWAKCQFMAEATTFPKSDGSTGEGMLLSYLEGETPISSVELFTGLQKYAKSPEMLDEDDLFFPIVLRGAIGSFSPIDRWEETGVMIDDLDRDGNPIIDKAGKVVKKPERQRAAEGYPLIQGRLDNPEEQIYTFQVTVNPLDDSVETINRVKFKFMNKKMARHLIALPSQELVFRTAFQKGMGTANDSFDHLTDTYKSMDSYVVGVMTRFSHDEVRDLNWIDIEGTMLVTVVQPAQPAAAQQILAEATTTDPAAAASVAPPSASPVPPVPPPVPAAPAPAPEPKPMPEAVHESPPIVDAPVVTEAPPVVEPQVLPPTPAAPVVPAAPPVIPPAAPAEAEQPLAARLKEAILETMELHTTAMSFEEFEKFGLCPEELIDPSTQKIKSDRRNGVEKAIDRVRKERGDKQVGSFGSTGPTSVSRLTAAEQKLMDKSGTFECAACGKSLPDTPEEQRKHWAECPENPKNKAKAKAETSTQ